MSMTTPSRWKVKQSVRLIATGENIPWPGLNIIQERYVNILVQFFPRGPCTAFRFFSILSPPSTLEKDNVSEEKFECNLLTTKVSFSPCGLCSSVLEQSFCCGDNFLCL